MTHFLKLVWFLCPVVNEERWRSLDCWQSRLCYKKSQGGKLWRVAGSSKQSNHRVSVTTCRRVVAASRARWSMFNTCATGVTVAQGRRHSLRGPAPVRGKRPGPARPGSCACPSRGRAFPAEEGGGSPPEARLRRSAHLGDPQRPVRALLRAALRADSLPASSSFWQVQKHGGDEEWPQLPYWQSWHRGCAFRG